MEIIRTNIVSPYRLHALVRLVVRLPNPTRQQLFDLLQPAALSKTQDAANNVFLAAQHLNLIVEDDNGIVTLNPDLLPADIEDIECFRHIVQGQLTGETQRNHDNYLLNLFTAWYAVQDERVFTMPDTQWADQFNGELGPEHGTSAQMINTTKIHGWLTWASFLGWGYTLKKGRSSVLIPDATGRLLSILPQLTETGYEEIPFREFVARLAGACPELDGGQLFELCWQFSRPADPRGLELSLMLSTGLRVLDSTGAIKLKQYGDAPEVWQLFRAEGHVNMVTHIGLVGLAG